MKRILFCISDFKQGGIPRCLQSILMNIDTSKYIVDVVCLNQKGPYKGNMPNCNVIKADWITEQLMVHSKKITYRNFIQNLPAIILKIIRAIVLKFLKKDILESRLKHISKSLPTTYDSAIAYAEGLPAFLVRNVKANKRLLWIHNDYKWIPPSEHIQKLTDFGSFDKICCVSKATQKSFDELFPYLKDKTLTIYNYTNLQYILHQAKERLKDDKFKLDKFTIISIGRVCWQKNFEAIPHIASEIHKNGCDFNWYILGNGPDGEVQRVKDAIIEYNVQDFVILLGARDNPYKYLKKANLFVMTSRYESYPTVINEALALDVPIVSVDIPPAIEMLSGYASCLAPIDKISEEITDIINDSEKFKALQRRQFININPIISQQLNDIL